MRSPLIFFVHNSKGMSLIELLTAMAIIPVILFGASAISLQAAQLSQTTDVNTKAVAEMDNVMSTLSRVIENGVLHETLSDGSTLESTVSNPNGCIFTDDDGNTTNDTCYTMLIRIPGSAPGKQFTLYANSRILEMRDVGDDDQPMEEPQRISYNRTISLPADNLPFQFEEQAVKVHFRFLGADNDLRDSSQIINLNGGSGVPA